MAPGRRIGPSAMNLDTSSVPHSDSTQCSKRKRGPCRGVKTCAIVEAFGRIKVDVSLVHGRVEDKKTQSLFSRECGFLAKHFTPLRYKKWKDIPTTETQVLLHRLLVKFDIDLSLKRVQRLVNYHFASSYRGLRNKMHVHYQDYSSLEQAKAHPHKYASKNDWEWLCDNIFSTEEFQKKSRKNKENRNKISYKHCGGSRPFVHHRVDSTTNDIELFEITHFSKKKKTWVDEKSKTLHDEMKIMEDQNNVSEGECFSDKEICQQVLGKRPGYVKGLGFGPKPLMHSEEITEETHRLQNIVTTQAGEIQEQKKEIEEQRKKIEKQTKEVHDMKDRMSHFEEMMKLLMFQSQSSLATPSQP